MHHNRQNNFVTTVMKTVPIHHFAPLSLALCLLLVFLGPADNFFAQTDSLFQSTEESTTPLFLTLPFNRLILTSHFNGAAFDVQPVDFPGGPRPNRLPQTGELVVRFVTNPSKEFLVQWAYVAKIELFSELVRDEFLGRFEALVTDLRSLAPNDEQWKNLPDRFELMFDYLRFLSGYVDELPDLPKLYDNYLFEEAAYQVQSGDFQTAFVRYERLYTDGIKRSSEHPGLEAAWSSALDQALTQESAAGNYVRCRQWLAHFSYTRNPLVQTWESKLLGETRKLLAESKLAFEKEELPRSYRLCEKALAISPKHEELLTWQKQIRQQAPCFHIVVGSPIPKHLGRSDAIEDDATQRARRLLGRSLADFDRPSLDGGIYRSGIGKLERSESNHKLTWTLQGPSAVDIHDIVATVSQHLHQNETDTKERYALGRWIHEVVASVEIESARRVSVRFNRPLLVPESLFVIPLVSAFHAVGDARLVGPNDDREPDVGTATDALKLGLFTGAFEEHGRADFFARKTQEHPPVVLFEHTVARAEEAFERISMGKVDVIERVAPWDIERFRQDSRFVVGQYAIPTAHFIVPNMNKPLTASRTFRRALVYGLNRPAILEKLGGRGTVTSVPFVRGGGLADPLGYAYDPSILPRPYEPKLAMVLSLMAFNQVRQRQSDWDKIDMIPELVLARPATEIEEYIALMLRRQWNAIGVRVRIVEYTDSASIGSDPEVDLWLVRRTIKEPLVDAERIFGPAGLVGRASPYMELALEKLRNAKDWAAAAKCLFDIHRLSFEETTVLPLWQMADYYVYRAEIRGLTGTASPTAASLIDLYQHIFHWQWTSAQ